MFSPAIKAAVPVFTKKKLAQWERVKGELPGLQLVRSGEAKTQFMLTYSPHDESFYESVVFGQLPQVHRVPKSKNKPPVLDTDWRDATPDELPPWKRMIDFSNTELDTVLALWASRKTALTLAFVDSVWRVDGKEYVKPAQKVG
jgi:hypothetical protein